jgi:hypothetical protein
VSWASCIAYHSCWSTPKEHFNPTAWVSEPSAQHPAINPGHGRSHNSSKGQGLEAPPVTEDNCNVVRKAAPFSPTARYNQVTSRLCFLLRVFFGASSPLRGHAVSLRPVIRGTLDETNWRLGASFTPVRAQFTWTSPPSWHERVVVVLPCAYHILSKIAGGVVLPSQDLRKIPLHAANMLPRNLRMGVNATHLQTSTNDSLAEYKSFFRSTTNEASGMSRHSAAGS